MEEPMTIQQSEIPVDDVDVNMMGIKSVDLYNHLSKIVEDRDLSVLLSIEPQEFFPDLINHLTDVIPNDLFHCPPGVSSRTDIEQLKLLGNYLRKVFMQRGQYPFTIVRICELCYDPFKYYKVFELSKFVRAIGKCCLVNSKWETNEDKVNIDKKKVEVMEEVALSKIPWIDETSEDKLVSFAKYIDEIMSVNLGFDDDDEDDNDIDTDKNNSASYAQDMNINSDDIIIEEYYEEDEPNISFDDLDENDDEEDDDADYVEKIEDDDDIDEDDDIYYEDVEVEKEEDDGKILDQITDNKTKENQHTINETENAQSYKRTTTELDDFDYNNNFNGDLREAIITPKKLKQDNMMNNVSPMMVISGDLPSIDNAADDDERCILVSPDSMIQNDKNTINNSNGNSNKNNNNNSKIVIGKTQISDECINDGNSPLTRKIRKD